MAFTERDEVDASGHTGSADHIDVDGDDGDRDEAGASTDLPAFLTEDEPCFLSARVAFSATSTRRRTPHAGSTAFTACCAS